MFHQTSPRTKLHRQFSKVRSVQLSNYDPCLDKRGPEHLRDFDAHPVEFSSNEVKFCFSALKMKLLHSCFKAFSLLLLIKLLVLFLASLLPHVSGIVWQWWQECAFHHPCVHLLRIQQDWDPLIKTLFHSATSGQKLHRVSFKWIFFFFNLSSDIKDKLQRFQFSYSHYYIYHFLKSRNKQDSLNQNGQLLEAYIFSKTQNISLTLTSVILWQLTLIALNGLVFLYTCVASSCN